MNRLANHSPENPLPDGTPNGVDPADYNLCWEWLRDCVAPLGFTVCAVEFSYVDAVLRQAGPGFEQQLGEQLNAADLGHFDSMKQGSPATLFFYLHTRDLVKALQFVLARLEALNILIYCKITHAEPETKTWRTLNPAQT
jgi:hypothetical protein